MVRRRTLVQGIAGAPLATVLANASLSQALAAEVPMIEIDTPGGTRVSAAVALPADTPAAAVVLIHEWWGLNDQIKTMANEFAKEGYLAVAVDLYAGKVASDPDTARALMQAVDQSTATETLGAWIDWVREHEASSSKVATVGWCFGGGWSLNASLAQPVDATVIYYGNVQKSEQELATLNSPVLGHFASADKFINKEMVDGFEQAMAAADKPFNTHWYDADHAFANPTTSRYDEPDAQLAWQRTLAFLNEHLA